MADLKKNWQLGAAAAAGVLLVGVGLYYLLKSDEAEETNDAEQTSPAASGSKKETSSASAASSAAAASSGGAGSAAVARDSSGGLTKEALKDMLDEMLSRLSELKTATDKRKDAMVAGGMPEEEADATLREQIGAQLESLEKEIQAARGIGQWELMEAQQKYREDPEIAERLQALRVLFFGEESIPEWDAMEAAAPADMTQDKFLHIMKEHMAVLEAAVKDSVEQTKRETRGRNFEERSSYFDLLMMRKLPAIQEEALARIGLTDEQFRGSMIKFGNDPDVLQLVMMSQARQEQIKEGLK